MKNFEKYIDELTDIDKVACKICKIRKFNCQTLVIGCEKIKAENKKWLLQEYVEPIHLTHDEYVILKNLDKKYKWITKDDGLFDVEVSTEKPYRCEDFWNSVGHTHMISFFPHLFQFIKWEDEEPYSIQQLIADYEKENCND